MNPPSGPTEKARVEPLDAIAILLLACTLALGVLWLARPAVAKTPTIMIPDFIQKAYSSIWTYLTGAGGSAVLAFLRGDKTRRPNYLVWTLGTTVVLIGLTFGVGFISPTPPPPLPKLALLKFAVKCEKNQRPNLSFLQKNPIFRQARPLAAEPSDGHYQEYVDWPEKDQQFEAVAVRSVLDTEIASNPISKPTRLCFVSNKNQPTNKPPFEVLMNCTEGEKCSFSPDDHGWADGCPKGDAKIDRPFGLVPELQAQSSPDKVATPGWRVPSLATLREMSDSKRVGYTEFSVTATSLHGLEKADSFRYAITANGSPIYVDGWASEDMLKEFSASKGLDFSFGLENLSFSGAASGCENIGLLLEFRKGNEVIETVRLARRYAALRDPVPEDLRSDNGLVFSWTGKYVKPKNEDRAEVFVLSTTDLREALRTKSQIADANLAYHEMKVVGVLRPPLNAPQYGLVIGLLQPTGQIKFTFDSTWAEQLRIWIMSQRSASKKLFTQAPFVYQMRPGDAGYGKLRSCSAAQG